MQARMWQPPLFTLVVSALVVGLGGQALAQTSEVGTWKLNVAKSKYSPGPAPKSGTTKIEEGGAGLKIAVDQVQADGSVTHWEYTANYQDKKDNRVTGNNPDADMIARTRTNATTVRSTNKKFGKITTTNMSVVSSDGKTRTVTTTGTNARGQTVNNVTVYDRQ
jgi:hypothetical protein